MATEAPRGKLTISWPPEGRTTGTEKPVFSEYGKQLKIISAGNTEASPATHYDAIIIGSGMGGGTVALQLAKAGRKVLILERGRRLPLTAELSSPHEVFMRGSFKANEVWYDGTEHPFKPTAFYNVGGNTVFYGAALLRFRAEDFSARNHYTGISPAWPISYMDLEPFYTAAEELFAVHGEQGLDPTEPYRSKPYPRPPVSHDPFVGEVAEKMRRHGLHPFPLPLGVMLDEQRPELSLCVRCGTCDGFGCLRSAKANALTMCVDPALRSGNVHLKEGTYVTRLETNQAGTEVTKAWTESDGAVAAYTADIFVVAAGAVNSAALLFRSASDSHPHGLANESGTLGRNYMSHVCSTFMLGLSLGNTRLRFPKTLALNDWYWGDADWPYPMGHVQTLGKIHDEIIKSRASYLPDALAHVMAEHSIAFSATSEDLPWPDNRVTVTRDGRIKINYRLREKASHQQLVKRATGLLRNMGIMSLRSPIILADSAHQCGTIRMGSDPADSVLDPQCKAHEIDNLYVADASAFVSSSATNPALTVAANALRVAAHINDRLAAVSAQRR